MMKFFSKWVLNPCNHDICPGYFHFLPDLLAAQPQDSVLRTAVEAAAFAAIADNDRQAVFILRSQRKYGASLLRLRDAMADPSAVIDDGTVAAILVIDTFEVRMTSHLLE